MAVNHTHIAVAIIFGALIVAGTIFFKFSSASQAPVGSYMAVSSPLRESDRLTYGSLDAPITIVEFSDFQCPFCAQLHPTLKRIVDESNGAIVWEYRHLPLQNHPEARPAAIASECVARELGLDSFWQFSETVFASMRELNSDVIKNLALDAGLSADTYDSCITDSEVIDRVNTDFFAAQALGGRGTPFSIVVSADGTQTPVSGALPYEQWKVIIDAL